MEEQDKKMPFAYVASTVLFTLYFALDEAEKVTKIIKEPENSFLNKNREFKKSWRILIYGLRNRLQNIFTAPRGCRSSQKDLDNLKKSCKMAKEEVSEIMQKLTICCQNYLTFNDCVCESAITKIIIVGTLLNHADGIWEYTEVNSYTQQIADKLRPVIEYRYFHEACKLSKVLPDDVNYMADPSIKNCIVILADKLGECAVKDFYEN